MIKTSLDISSEGSKSPNLEARHPCWAEKAGKTPKNRVNGYSAEMVSLLILLLIGGFHATDPLFPLRDFKSIAIEHGNFPWCTNTFKEANSFKALDFVLPTRAQKRLKRLLVLFGPLFLKRADRFCCVWILCN